MQITDGGFVTTTGGLIIMHNCCGTPRGVNPNDKTVVISPPGRTTTGGLMKTLHRTQDFPWGRHPVFLPSFLKKIPWIRQCINTANLLSVHYLAQVAAFASTITSYLKHSFRTRSRLHNRLRVCCGLK